MSNFSSRPGMGAILYNDGTNSGTTFRVWAPFAMQVWVSGSFVSLSTDKKPLFSEGNGYWSADISEAKLNDHYWYIIKSPFTSPEGQRRTDPYCKNVLDNESGDGVIISSDFDWSSDTFLMPPWNELVIYELHVASFNRTEHTPGSFSSMIDKLDYLKDLGVSAVEIMPIIGVYGPYSLGYNPAFPFDIESTYGSATDFKNFIKAAHQKGIAIILDIVLNHFGPEELDYSLWRFDG